MDAYVPVYSNGENTWFPANEPAVELVHLIHVWRDIPKLNDVRLVARSKDPIADKLLLKYMLVEFFSACDHAKKLQGLIRTSPRLVVGKPPPFRYITKKDLERATEAYKGLWRDLAPLEPVIANIRNNIGAHRSAEIGREVEALWEELDAERFIRLMNRIPAVIKAVEGINIYNWSWMDAGAMVGSIFGGRIIHDWEDAFSEGEGEQHRGASPPPPSAPEGGSP